MKKLIIIGLIILVTINVLLSGCISSGEIVYHKENDKNTTLTLYPDGKFISVEPNSDLKGASGTYKFDGDKLILLVEPFNTPIVFENHGVYIIMENGKGKWIKE